MDKKEFEDFVAIKRWILYDLFISNNLKEFYGLYSDVYFKIIGERKEYNFKVPLHYFFSMALRGYPKRAYYLCKLNLFLLLILKKIKRYLSGYCF